MYAKSSARFGVHSICRKCAHYIVVINVSTQIPRGPTCPFTRALVHAATALPLPALPVHTCTRARVDHRLREPTASVVGEHAAQAVRDGVAAARGGQPATTAPAPPEPTRSGRAPSSADSAGASLPSRFLYHSSSARQAH